PLRSRRASTGASAAAAAAAARRSACWPACSVAPPDPGGAQTSRQAPPAPHRPTRNQWEGNRTMSFTIELDNGDHGMSGWGARDQRAAEKRLPELVEQAREDARRSGRPLSAYRITIVEH